MTALEFFKYAQELTKSTTLNDGTDYSQPLADFMKQLSDAQLEWIKPFPNYRPNQYRAIFNDVAVNISVNDGNKYPVILSHDSHYVTLFANHVDCLKCIVIF